jgi:hypothetical protein
MSLAIPALALRLTLPPALATAENKITPLACSRALFSLSC